MAGYDGDDMFDFMDAEQDAHGEDGGGGSEAGRYQPKKDLKIFLIDVHAAMLHTYSAVRAAPLVPARRPCPPRRALA